MPLEDYIMPLEYYSTDRSARMKSARDDVLRARRSSPGPRVRPNRSMPVRYTNSYRLTIERDRRRTTQRARPSNFREDSKFATELSDIDSTGETEYEFIYDSESDSTDEDDEPDFTFDAPHLDTSFDSGITGQAPDIEQNIQAPADKPLDRKISQIVSSKYVESGESEEGVFGGSLTRVSGRVSSLYRWLHMSPDTMNFGEFSDIATSLPGLSRVETNDISLFLKRVRNQHEKPIRSANSRNGWYMKPTVNTKPKDRTRSSSVDDVSAGNDKYIFCSFPYFRLEQYNSTALPEGGHLHPSQPLFQSHYPSVDKQRDLQQVVCKLQGVPTGHCFHVPALWCLLISDKYILTYSRNLSVDDILAESLPMQHLPAPGATVPFQMPAVLQLVYDGRLWLLSIDQCNTWFKLTCQLSDLTLNLEGDFIIRWLGHTLGPAQWPKLISQAKRVPTRVQLTRRKHEKPGDSQDNIFSSFKAESQDKKPEKQSDDQPVPRERFKERFPTASQSPSRRSEDLDKASTDLKDEPKKGEDPRESSSSPIPPPRTTANPVFKPRDFHALLWAAVGPSNTATSELAEKDSKEQKNDYQEKIESYMERLHIYMQNNENKKAQFNYEHTGEKTFEDMDRVLTGLRRTSFDSEEDQSQQIKFASLAESIFQIFLPLEWRSAQASRYWGAALTALTTVPSRKSKSFHRRTLQVMDDISKLGKDLRIQLSAGKGPDPRQTNIPRDFTRAWYHALLCMLYWSSQNMEPSYKQARSCLIALLGARRKMFKIQNGPKFSELEAVLPSGILVFMLHSLLKDVTGQYPDIRTAYWEYYTDLEREVRESPLDRSHQRKVSAFIDEIRIIRNHLSSQKRIISNFDDRLYCDKERRFRGYDDVSSPQADHLRQCISTLEERSDSFLELLHEAERLSKTSSESIRLNKDYQETAIFIFTVVTVIFLPLNTVTSYLGMNTSDIRDMESKQWVFWAAAIPLAIIVLLLARVWAGSSTSQSVTTLPAPGGVQTGSDFASTDSDFSSTDLDLRRRSRKPQYSASWARRRRI